jgi:hypothetical protein
MDNVTAIIHRALNVAATDPPYHAEVSSWGEDMKLAS